MIDRLLAEGVFPPAWVPFSEKNLRVYQQLNATLSLDLQQSPVIVADNVAEYLYAGTDQEEWDTEKDFPGIAPPFQSFWIEHGRPRITRSEGKVLDNPEHQHIRLGVFFECETAEEVRRRLRHDSGHILQAWTRSSRASFEHMWGRYGASITAKLSAAGGDARAAWEAMDESERTTVKIGKSLDCGSDELVRSIPEECAWLMRATVYWELPAYGTYGAKRVFGPAGNHSFLLDSAGNPIRKPMNGVGMPANLEGIDPNDPSLTMIVDDSNNKVFVSLLTLSFMNCKNVRKVLNEPDAPLSRKFEKKHGRPLQKFYTLQIEAMGEILRKEGESEKTGLRKALHICRGHFSDYSEGKGLFGKYHGRYWVPSHIRGKRAFGTVEKDYEVSGPAEKAA